jgi:hypothetical protein
MAEIKARVIRGLGVDAGQRCHHYMYVFRWTYLIDKYNLSANQVDKEKTSAFIGERDLN